MRWPLSAKPLFPVLALMLVSAPGPLAVRGGSNPVQNPPGVPWNDSQIVVPEELVKTLALPANKRPAIICVGFKFLYKGGHIPGALYKGPARDASGLKQLMAWSRSIRKDAPLVIYCGCCPVSRCPNIRPAFEALLTAGFVNIRVLDLPQSFVRDWTQKGYPIQKIGK